MVSSKPNQLKNLGFTLIEILLVVALSALLAGIVIIAVNPGKQLADGRNTRRSADVTTIINAVYQYEIDNRGTLPGAIQSNADCSGTSSNEICKTGGSCSGLTDLTPLTTNEKYLPSIPVDPGVGAGNNTGYFIHMDSNNRITVCAPNSENGVNISVTR
jgi:prepilin-type N-terminal cleavage/methylation domain-containing protein